MYNNNNFGRKNDNDKQGQQQGREPLRLKIDKFDEFKSTVGTSLITSMKLTKKINGLFRSAGIALAWSFSAEWYLVVSISAK